MCLRLISFRWRRKNFHSEFDEFCVAIRWDHCCFPLDFVCEIYWKVYCVTQIRRNGFLANACGWMKLARRLLSMIVFGGANRKKKVKPKIVNEPTTIGWLEILLERVQFENSLFNWIPIDRPVWNFFFAKKKHTVWPQFLAIIHVAEGDVPHSKVTELESALIKFILSPNYSMALAVLKPIKSRQYFG